MVELLVDIGIVLLNTLFWALVLLGLPGAWLMIATCALVEWQLLRALPQPQQTDQLRQLPHPPHHCHH